MIISFGESLIDMIQEGSCFRPFPGGAPLNFAVGVSRLGLKCKMIACVGNDIFGKTLVNMMKKEGIDTQHVKKINDRTTLAFVQLDENGIPEFFFYRCADKEIKREDIDENIFKEAKLFHFGSLSLTEGSLRETLFHCLELAKKHSVTISFTPNIREDLWKEEFNVYLKKALEYPDLIILSKSELDYMAKIEEMGEDSFEERAKKITEHGIKLAAITLGKDGAALAGKNLFLKTPAFNVNVVDTTGAGDAFASAFVYAFLNGFEAEKMLRFANAAAAISITKKGAISALPKKADVEKFITDFNDSQEARER